MNLIKSYKEKGLSGDGRKNLNIIVGCILASDLDNKTKRELLSGLFSYI